MDGVDFTLFGFGATYFLWARKSEAERGSKRARKAAQWSFRSRWRDMTIYSERARVVGHYSAANGTLGLGSEREIAG